MSGSVSAPKGDEVNKLNKDTHERDQHGPIEQKEVDCEEGNHDAAEPQSQGIGHVGGLAGRVTDA